MAARPDARKRVAHRLRLAANRFDPPNGRPAGRALRNRLDPNSALHARARALHERLHLHKDVSDYDSRLLELVDYFGWEKGHKAHYCRRWFFGDDDQQARFCDTLDITFWEYAVMHQYSLFNRWDPARPDMFWAHDELMTRLAALGGPSQVSVLDFGAGLGQIGLGYAMEGYRTVLVEKVSEQIEFAHFLGRQRGVELNIHQTAGDRDYYDTGADGHRYGLVIEWSVFEHIYEMVKAADEITRGLVPGGIFLTTTFAKDWTDELKEWYVHDSGDEEISSQFWAPETEQWVADNFDVVDVPGSIAKLLIKR
jgi:2-polyprenyl-3-methyl-5-hydroxy-6-metoxy-1,4-benzoquinol methylase